MTRASWKCLDQSVYRQHILCAHRAQDEFSLSLPKREDTTTFILEHTHCVEQTLLIFLLPGSLPAQDRRFSWLWLFLSLKIWQ